MVQVLQDNKRRITKAKDADDLKEIVEEEIKNFNIDSIPVLPKFSLEISHL